MVGLGFTPEVGLGLVPTLVLFPPGHRTDSPTPDPAVPGQGSGSPSRNSRPRALFTDAGAQAPALPREGPLRVLGARGCMRANPRQTFSQQQEAFGHKGGALICGSTGCLGRLTRAPGRRAGTAWQQLLPTSQTIQGTRACSAPRRQLPAPRPGG